MTLAPTPIRSIIPAGAPKRPARQGRPDVGGPSSMRLARAMAIAGLALAGAAAAAAQGPNPPPGGPAPSVRMGLSVEGETIFNADCRVCHAPQGQAGADPRAPAHETLRQFPPERILSALTSGKMQAQGAALSEAQRRAVSEWLSGRTLGSAAGDAKLMSNRCSPAAPARPWSGAWNGWSPTGGNARFQTAAAAGLGAADLPRLKLRWAFGLPNGVETYSQPSVLDGSLYIGGDSGNVYALDAVTGCVRWSFLAMAGVRTAPVVATVGSRRLVVVGDLKANLYAIDAADGGLVWRNQVDDQTLARITGAPALYAGKLFVGTSSSEEISGLQANYECCRMRGTVSAVDLATGRTLWKTYTIATPAHVLGVRADGRRRWGPAGVSVWSTPTVDPKRGVIYVTTGDSFTEPADPLSDSVVALSMASGKPVWSYQATRGDAFMVGCDGHAGPNCPTTNGPDYDFGSSAALVRLAGGREILVAAHKGGGVAALDPDRRGRLIWSTALARKPASARGEIVFGGASDGASAYYALQESAGVAAVDLATGRTRWFTPVSPPDDRPGRRGSAAAVTAVPGVVFSGGWDGVLRAFAAADGRELWRFDTARAFETVNGVPARGGSLAAPGAVVAEGMMFVGSGYVGISNGLPGNVLLAFAVEPQR